MKITITKTFTIQEWMLLMVGAQLLVKNPFIAGMKEGDKEKASELSAIIEKMVDDKIDQLKRQIK